MSELQRDHAQVPYEYRPIRVHGSINPIPMGFTSDTTNVAYEFRAVWNLPPGVLGLRIT